MAIDSDVKITINISELVAIRASFLGEQMSEGEIEEEEMRKVFNLGIGYCVVVSKELVTETQNIISSNGLKSWVIGTTK